MKSDLMDMALERLVNDMDDLEGSAAMAHSAEDCPDPLSCTMHDEEHGDSLSAAEPGGVEIKVSKIGPGMPSLDGAKDGDGDEAAEGGLSPEEAEELRKLIK